LRRLFGKHLIRGLDQDVRVLGLEHDIWIELFHDVIKARDGRGAFIARLDPDPSEGMAASRRHLPQREGRPFSRLGLLRSLQQRLSLVDSRWDGFQ
jgi:hypothetical protein